MQNLQSVNLVNFNHTDNKGIKVTIEEVFYNKTLALYKLEKTDFLDGIGLIPCFYNGKKVRSKKAIFELLKNENRKRLVIKLTMCNDTSQGFERALSVNTFNSQKSFKESVHYRFYSFYTDTQKQLFKRLTK